VTDYNMGHPLTGEGLDENNGYAPFTFHLNLDTEQIYCIRQVAEDIRDFLSDAQCREVIDDPYLPSQQKIDHYTHILEKLEEIVKQADESFIGK